MQKVENIKENQHDGTPPLSPVRVLNLYSGIGGNRKLWQDVEVTAVEFREDIAKLLV